MFINIDINMENPSLSPPSPASSGDGGEILTPAQRGPAATLPSTPPPAPTASDSHPPSEEAELDIELAKARFGDYLRRMEKKDDDDDDDDDGDDEVKI